ncbi:hypothetical protein [Variovorax sp. OV329]|uniref:hypothetical protein n=1 Tax=Variovorax sp. OV329 TaxID=1882825 RepID=UPI0008E77069|nr:hypothetical protein [Variovorax sp. OV329]SFM80996.1 hypothetical protein SAMN05444747_10933 [Variovorax sp. OV329]
MAAKYILAALALVFFAAALWRLARDGFKLASASRTWLVVALIFGAVSAWLWWSGGGRP